MKAGWTQRKIDDICDFRGGGTPSKANENYWRGEIPWVSPKDMKSDVITDSIDHISANAIEESTTNLIPSGSVLVVVRSGILARTVPVAITGREVAINQDIKALCPDKSVDSWFLFYFLKSRLEEMLALASRGATVHRIMADQIRAMEIPVPPLAEQRRIVGVLDEAFASLATAQAHAAQNLQNARALFESHLNAIFTERGEGWERITLEELLQRGWIEGHLDGNHGSDYPKKDEFIIEGVPYISANCIVEDRVVMAKSKFLSPQRAAMLRKGIARNNDVLFAHNATVGPVAILRTTEAKVILGTSLTYYRCNHRHIIPEYLAHYMRSSEFTFQYSQVMKQSTRNQVPITKQREFFHIIPPIEEQKEIASSLEGLLENSQRLIRIYEQKLAALAELKNSLLHQAFSGEL
jgi:type I restriction enzyme S subunit